MIKLWECNVFSLVGVASYLGNLESGLTILLLVTAIVLNIRKLFDKNDKRDT
jgi:hypothetical protein